MTVFKILTLATNELVLARHSETQHDEQIQLGAHVGVSMEGQIQIQVGDYDYKTHLGSLVYTSPIQIEDDGEMSGVFMQYRDLYFDRSEEHTSELQSLMRISYAVFCLKKKSENHIPQISRHIYSPTIKIQTH